ncbi:MAG TPA: ester cyclase [Polyangiaceae bacterium]|nr:ester cyclase [Polyangiaceae bacterium]
MTQDSDRISVNLELTKRFYVAFDSREPSRMDALVAETGVDHDGGGVSALVSMRGLVGALATGFDEYHHRVELALPIGDDKVFIRWRMEGTHTGELFGVPASNKKIFLHGHDLIRIDGGKIVELWHVEQLLQMMQQIKG